MGLEDPAMDPNPLRQLFESTNRKRVYPKGSVIVMQGGDTSEVFMITSGLVRVYDIDSTGTNRTVAIIAENSIFPFMWLLANESESGAAYFYQAVTSVTCLSATRVEARKLLNDPAVSCRMIDLLTKAYVNAGARIQNIQHSQVSERVDFIIYYLAMILGEEKSEGIYKINAPITHQEIADLAGLNRETISRQMTKKKYKDVMQRKQGSTYINLSPLDIDSMPKIFRLKAA
jgi:CRP-like cAMP-binding protein